MKVQLQNYLLIVGYLLSFPFYGQDVSLYKQYNGRYDFLFVGNTLNTIENNNIEGLPEPPCTILSNSSATLYLNLDDRIENAYLYWAGSGTGDFEVKLNGQDIIAQRTFSISNSFGFPFFSAFADVTSFIQATGNGNYTFSNLDLSDIIDDYCPFGGNFGGWAIVLIYKNDALPLNQLNVYDGMQSVPDAIQIKLDNLNVIDNKDAKIGFVAWEGDKNIAEGESLYINGNLMDNPPLNPGNNAFNGTNSFLGTDTLFNMDLDVYNIENNISVGDTKAEIELTSNRDFVMINAIVTKLTSYFPFTVYNFVSANNDTVNDSFTIKGLRSNYPNFTISIYNRWGTLVWTGDINSPDWDGHANQGVLLNHSEVPEGTYYYVLDLNDPDYSKPLVGYLFLTR